MWNVWGISGGFNYHRPDTISQANLWPDLYRYLDKRESELILSDMLTSEPITALTNSYVVVRRPWATDLDVLSMGQAILLDPASAWACGELKARNISLVLVNRADLPPDLIDLIRTFPDARDGVYADDLEFSRADHLQQIAEFHGIKVFHVQTDNCPPI